MTLALDILNIALCALGAAYCIFVVVRSKRRGWVRVHGGYGAERVAHRADNPALFSLGIWQQYLGVVFCVVIAVYRVMQHVGSN
mgnify:CR=1 FL=1